MSNLIQNTEPWYLARKSRIGASDVPIILGLSRFKTAFELWEQKLGLSEDKTSEFATSRGRNLEGIAREHYELHTGIKMIPTVFFHKDFNYFMASLDGWSEEKKLVLEVKNPGKEDHETARDGKVPLHYMAQIQFQMFVADTDKAHYWSFDGQDGHLVHVQADEKYILETILPAAHAFKHMIDTKNPPALTEKDYKNFQNPGLIELLGSYSTKLIELKEKKSEVDKMKEEIFSLAFSEHPRIQIGNVKIVSSFRKGHVDYGKIPEIKGVDLEKYRKKSTAFRAIYGLGED